MLPARAVSLKALSPILAIVWGSCKEVSSVWRIESDNRIEERLEQPSNALEPIAFNVLLSEKITLFKEVQSLNAELSIPFADLGMITEEIFLFSLNASDPMVITSSGMVTVVSVPL